MPAGGTPSFQRTRSFPSLRSRGPPPGTRVLWSSFPIHLFCASSLNLLMTWRYRSRHEVDIPTKTGQARNRSTGEPYTREGVLSPASESGSFILASGPPSGTTPCPLHVHSGRRRIVIVINAQEKYLEGLSGRAAKKRVVKSWLRQSIIFKVKQDTWILERQFHA